LLLKTPLYRVDNRHDSAVRGRGAPVSISIPYGSRPGRISSEKAAYTLGLGGLVWITAHALGLIGPLDQVTFFLLGFTTTCATVIGVRHHRPALRWPWVFVACALVIFLVGGMARLALNTTGDLTANRSLIPDLITLPGYLIVGTALGGFVFARNRQRGRDVDALLDGLVAALASLTLAWVYLINPALFHAHAPLSVRVVLACYPPASVFLVALMAPTVFTSGSRRNFSQRVLFGSMVCMLAGDVVYMLFDAHILFVPQRLIDLPYALAYLGTGVSALHPSMRELCEPIRSDDVAPTRGRLAIVAVALAIPALISLRRVESSGGGRIFLVLVVLVLTITAVLRMLRALREHAASEARFAYQATHDTLTKLPNRTFVSEHLVRGLGRTRADGSSLAVLFLDIDRFKLVNDTGGHGMGDELLVAIAKRLLANVGEDGVVARIGGDEFVIVLDRVADVVEVVHRAEDLRMCFQEPFEIRGSDIYSSTSIGVTFINGENADADPESVIRDADTAMYQAKAAGRDGVAVFDASMRDQVAQRLALEQDLRNALGEGQLILNYQPIVDMYSEDAVGFEALIRWIHPTRGVIPPMTFIPIAEETGLIVEIGAWVLQESCRQLAEWRRTVPGADDLYVAVNVSARQLRHPHLIATTRAALDTSHLPAGALCLELTESMLMDDPETAAETLRALQRLGLKLSIDDFGTGYSSLSYLKRFPVDHVKIDRAFVDGLDAQDSSEESLVAAIIAMARALGMSTVAEGVETTNQADRLRQLGADKAQGYLYSRPVAASEIPATLKRLRHQALYEVAEIA
jgi:diguanylate cyclase (GGDEF)-like protein